MPNITTYKQNALATLMSVELNSLANNSRVLATNFYNNTDGYLWGLLQLSITFAAAPTANTNIVGWFMRSIDTGTTIEDGSVAIAPTRAREFAFTVRGVNTIQHLFAEVRLPPGYWKPLLLNDATGQPFPNAGTTLKLLPYAFQNG